LFRTDRRLDSSSLFDSLKSHALIDDQTLDFLLFGDRQFDQKHTSTLHQSHDSLTALTERDLGTRVYDVEDVDDLDVSWLDKEFLEAITNMR
jgi:hypothetical protein